MKPFVKTDGGRIKAGFLTESNDCTVRALAIAGDMSYRKAHEMMELSGRVSGHGAHIRLGLEEAEQRGLLHFKRVVLPTEEREYRIPGNWYDAWGDPITAKKEQGPNVTDFIRMHPKGRYILRVRKHVFAVINGQIRDVYRVNGNCIVRAAHQIAPRY